MVSLLQRPILIGGLGLATGAWLLGSLDPGLMHSSTAVLGTLGLGAGLWWLKLRSQPADRPLLPFTPVDRTAVEKALAEVESQIERLALELQADSVDATPAPVLRLRQQLAALSAELGRKDVRLAIMGGRSVGKTALTQLLQARADTGSPVPIQKALSIQKTEPPQPEGDRSPSVTAEVENADLVLFLTAGDLTDSELQILKQLIAKNHRLLLLFNKQDQYLPADRPVILQQIRDRMATLLAAEDVIATTAHPAPVKVRQHQPDGTFSEHFEQPAPDVAVLQQRMQAIFTHESQTIIFATLKRQAQALNAAVQSELNQVLRQRALPVIEQYQWIAGAAAFANPVASLDLLSTATINAQLVVDLGAIYQQKFSLEQAKTVMGNLASQMVKLGLVEIASQAIAPLLKSNALTYVAGGTLQGFSAAYLTRIAGLSLVEYFEEQSLNPAGESSLKLDRLVQKVKAVFEANQRSEVLRSWVKQGISRLAPESSGSSTPSVVG
ncbi:MAG TPA: DUF697 domain-containing protein [Coleofasciculaceae cyanobacterium]